MFNKSVTFETYTQFSDRDVDRLIKDEPSVFNSDVSIVKYRVTIEPIKESTEVYRTRLQKLWDECTNHHHWAPMRKVAELVGITLEGSAGSKRKDRS